MDHLATITASELTKRAQAFADDIVGRLEHLNEQCSIVGIILTSEQIQMVSEGPQPRDKHQRFQELFCEYMATQYVIIPG